MIKRLLHAIFGHNLSPVKFDKDIYRREIAVVWRSRIVNTVPKNKAFLDKISQVKEVKMCDCGRVSGRNIVGEVTNFYI